MPRAEEPATDIVSEGSRPAATGARRRLVLFWEDGTRAHDLPERGTVTVGRTQSCTLAVDHRSVSRVHAAIHVGASVVIEDLGSANGTFVEGRRLTAGERVAVTTGSTGAFGVVSFVVLALGGSPAEEPPGDAMKRLDQLVEIVAPSDISVIIQGETGAGKEVLAERIHRSSRRAGGPFVRLNCAALPDALLESELFGHERGAFTGAVQSKIGLLEAASGGTIFLDEIGEMALATQAKLLRAIEAREVTRLGSVKPRTIDVRFLAATHRDLEANVETGAFRRDLYFRLNGISLTIPPLRERLGELPSLVRTFVTAACTRAGQEPVAISDRAMAALRAHTWPGNVRELKNVVERAVLLARGGAVDLEHVDLGATASAARSSVVPAAPAPAAAGAGAPLPGSPSTPGAALPSELASLERSLIVDALEKSGGNQKEAAKLLGISRRTLVYRLDQYDLPRPRKRT